jgi:hypothetical protein
LCTRIEQAAVFKDKVYVVTGDARIGILNLLDSQPRVRMLEVHGGDQAPGCLFLDSLNLVASDEQYFVMVLYMKRHLLIRFTEPTLRRRLASSGSIHEFVESE